jgi:hypothetical protein
MKRTVWQWKRVLAPAGLAALLIFPVACASTGTSGNNGGMDSAGMSGTATTPPGGGTSGATTGVATDTTSGTTNSGTTTGTTTGTTSTGGSTMNGTSGSSSTYGSTGTGSTSGTTGSSTMAGNSSGNGSTYGTGTTGTGTTASGYSGSTGTGSTAGTSGNSAGTGSTYGSTGTSSNGSGSSFAGGSTGTSASGGTSSGTYGSTYGSTSGSTSTGDTYGTSGGMTSSTTQGSTGADAWRSGGFYGSRGTAGSGGHMFGLTVSGVRASFNNNNSSGNIGGTAGTGSLNSDFGNANGFGLGLTTFLGRMFAVDLGASYLRPRVNFTPTTAGFGTIGGGRLRMIPLTALLQLHILPGAVIDPYLGAGGGYMLMRNATGFNTTTTGLERVSYDNRFGAAYQGGVVIGIRGFGLNLDAKYLPLNARGTGQFATSTGSTFIGTQGASKINPWLFSAGLTFGF